jgi:hypothetical protein
MPSSQSSPQPGVERARVGVASVLKGAKPHRVTPQFPQHCWADEDRVLIRLCDDLQHCTVDDEIWTQLTAHHSDEAILELLMLAGTYRTVSYLVNGLRLPLEPGARRFRA